MTFNSATFQILLLDLVFSLDSIITTVDMTDDAPIMVVAVIVAGTAMLLAADPLARFIGNNPAVIMSCDRRINDKPERELLCV